MASLYSIKKEAAAQGLSRKELSELSGVSQGTLSSIFTGKTNPGQETLKKLTIAVFGSINAADTAPDPEMLIPRYSAHLVKSAAEVLGVREPFLRKQIRNGTFTWGQAFDFEKGRGTYLIDRQLFLEEYGIVLQVPRIRRKRKEDTNEGSSDTCSDQQDAGQAC